MTNGTNGTPDQVVELLRSSRTLVLATADPRPWSAPVYFVYLRQRFYFFSSPRSRHIVALEQDGQCAASIYRDGDHWRDIEGLQLDGVVVPLECNDEAAEVFHAYVAKFPTVKDFFEATSFDLLDFLDRFRTRLYAFAPRNVFYLNNRAGIGKRRPIELPPDIAP